MAQDVAKPMRPLPVARVCGALGAYDRSRVREMADLLGPSLRLVHRDRRSILWLDRDPVRWSGGGSTGLAWTEGPRRPATVESWDEAATTLDGCGLVLHGRRRFVHASVSGLSPVYWMDEGGATYFASRIEPLVETARRRLRPDWEAWAAILGLGYPIGSRTTFEEVRRLEHCGTLERDRGNGIAVTGNWPWSEVELLRDPDDAAEGLAGALCDAIEPSCETDVVVPLSGGGDSRLLLAAVNVLRPRTLSTWTLPGTWGFDDDLAPAREVARRLGVKNTVLGLEREGYWADFAAVCEGSEYQQALEWAWLVPLARALADRPGIAIEGLAGDILVGGKFATAEVLAAPDSDSVSAQVWRRLHRTRRPGGSLKHRLATAITDTAQAQVRRATGPLAGHPAQLTLSIYRLRSTRGMSAGPTGVLGTTIPTVSPYVSNAVARAALACPPEAKPDGGLHRRVIERIAPELAGVPVTSYGPAPSRRPTFRRERSAEALVGAVELLRECPLRPWFRGPLAEAVATRDPDRLADVRPYLFVNGLLVLTLWQRRYGDRLESVNPRALLR